ncbi:hypothetical protein FH039_07190 [Thermococcus indicus]|uniref:Uncharacterized protein n=1 Tax=Thermococcus indicus TaxID=2586643 RepID=A0A4Y5SKJ6_9EURY|nr:hypothetical protein [Thermococcus indicus]QDA31428.1 hypothetical protein FH039_07190 [Thermococcus indicus]
MKAEETAIIPFILICIGLMLSLLWGGNSGSLKENVELSFYIILAIPVALAIWRVIHEVWKHTSNAVVSCLLGIAVFMGFGIAYGILTFGRVDKQGLLAGLVIGTIAVISEYWKKKSSVINTSS